MSKYRKLLGTIALATFLCLLPGQLTGQTYQGSVRGLITDPSGAVVAGAKVTLTSEAKQTMRTAVSDGAGQYNFPAVDPDTYTVTVEQQGFKRFARSGVVVGTQATATVDVSLELGAQSQTVQVTTSVPLLNTADASVSTTLEAQQIEDLPSPATDGRNQYTLSYFSPAVVPTQNLTAGAPDTGNVSFMTVAGSPLATNLYLLDGIPITTIQSVPEFIPIVEATQETKTQIMTYDANMGRTGGGVWNTLLKSGTNRLHGSLYGMTGQGDWNANSFFNNRNHIARPPSSVYEYAGSLGGPVIIPHLYNGKNRTFWFIAEEGFRYRTTSSGTFHVPTALEKTGDFSQSYTTVNGVPKLDVIYDPLSTVLVNGVPTRTPFQGNVIPIDRRSQVGLNIAAIYPTAPPGSLTGSADYTNTAVGLRRGDQMVAKIDQQMTHWWLANVSYVHGGWILPQANTLGVISNTGGRNNYRHADATTLNNIITINPTTVLSVRFGFNRYPTRNLMSSYGFNPTQLGFPDYDYQQLFFPAQTLTNFTELGLDGSTFETYSSRNFITDISKYVGRHNLSAGFEYRTISMAFQDNGDAPGNYAYNGEFTQANPLASANGTGSALADLILGLPSSGDIERSQYFYNYVRYFAGFIQDNFRLNAKLSLNFGLRYEYETGLEEKHNALVLGFNPNAASPLASTYAPSQGGFIFAGQNGKDQCCDLSNKKFAPRFGFSYALTPKTIVRGGYGIMYPPVRYDANAYLSPGYTSRTPLTSTTNGGLTPAPGFSLSNPFPAGALAPSGNTLGLTTSVGTAVAGYSLQLKTPYIQEFSVDVQRQVPGGVMIDVSYLGSRGRRLVPAPQGTGISATGGSTTNIDQLNPSYFSMGGAALAKSVTNPYYTPGGPGMFGNPTVSQQQLLLPYPQFLSVNLVASTAASAYNAISVSAEKRLTNGLSFHASYVYSKNVDGEYSSSNPGPQNVYDLKSEYSYATDNFPSRAVGLVSYDLPFGEGKRFFGGSRWGTMIYGGWRATMDVDVQSGQPLQITQNNLNSSFGPVIQRPNLTGAPIATSGSLYNRLSHYLNSAAFSTVAAYQFGNTPRTINSVLTPGINDWDLSLTKTVSLKEGVNLSFQAQSYDIFNTPFFGSPDMKVTDTSFGQITSASGGRTIKLGGRISF